MLLWFIFFRKMAIVVATKGYKILSQYLCTIFWNGPYLHYQQTHIADWTSQIFKSTRHQKGRQTSSLQIQRPKMNSEGANKCNIFTASPWL